MSERPQLRALARQLGILEGYGSALDHGWVKTLDSSREALCAAMGYEAGSEAAAKGSLALLESEAGSPDEHGFAAAPSSCLGVDELVGEETRVFGIWANLYSVRSQRNMGFGDLADLADLARWVGREGGAFVGVNPLHTLSGRVGDPCPYRPSSRLYREPLYLAIDAIPELANCGPARRRLESGEHMGGIEALRRAARLDIENVRSEVEPLLRMLFDAFVERRRRKPDAPRFRRFAEYRAQQGKALEDFATHRALVDQQGTPDWREWPASLRDPRHRAVEAFRRADAKSVEFYTWQQYELDRQLGLAAAAAKSAGLSIGLYTDLALGSDPAGSDAWAFSNCYARGVTLGAPPDDFSRAGQSWEIPPMIPRALRDCGYEPWRLLLRAGFRHAGALRIDHALGLRRQYWIPEGRPAHEGAYVMQPERALFDIVAQESRRAGSLVIAEDLGTVPPGFSDLLSARALLSSRVLLFEREPGSARFRPRSAYPRHCLATVNTHDLPPFAAFLSDEDLGLRRRSGQIPDDVALEELRASRQADREALRQRLIEDGLLASEAADDCAFATAASRFLCETPAALVGLGLDDLAGEAEPINLPGVPRERHASWTRRMSIGLEALPDEPSCRRTLEAIPQGRRLGGRPSADPDA